MKADAYSLNQVFSNERQLFAPLFQRPYVWNKEKQWEPLWEDIRKMVESNLEDPERSPSHFLGAVVLEQINVPIGKPDARSIIDGQQRLTTLQIFLAAFRDICINIYPETKLSQAINKFIYNDEDIYPDEEDKFKLWPTNIDREPYKLVINAKDRDQMHQKAKKKNFSSKQLIQAYEYFHKQIYAWAQNGSYGSTEKLKTLYFILRQNLRLVVIDMGKDDDAQVIFETLNARGTPLLPTDLVKNFLFHKAIEENKKTESLYDLCWREFDENESFWRGEITHGRLKRPLIDLFLQHYLTLMKLTDISLNSLFSEYQDFAKASGKDSEFLLRSFHEHAEHFKHFFSIKRDSYEGKFFYKLKVLDTTTVFPFLLGLYQKLPDNEFGQQEKYNILQSLESYLIRRSVCGLTPKNYNKLFIDLLISVLESEKSASEAVKEFLLSKKDDTGRWPDDDEFYNSWLNRPLYNAIRRNRLRLLLKDLDMGLHTNKTEYYTLRDDLTVEHIMPQHWEEHWPVVAEDEQPPPEEILRRKEERNRLIHTIGNLTFLTESLNPAISNGPFQRKREEILNHSAINLNRYLRQYSSWDEQKIKERSNHLFEIAKQCWPHPRSNLAGNP